MRIDQLSSLAIVDLINTEDRLVAAAVSDERPADRARHRPGGGMLRPGRPA
jgi:N-acetylmuramic acid 6-phosphate (MurNAc-6-P) etherase